MSMLSDRGQNNPTPDLSAAIAGKLSGDSAPAASDAAASPEAPEAPAVADKPTGQAEAAQPEPVAAAALDVSQFGDHTVTVTVDGQEVAVPLSEALQGYARQADYTRKAQALSRERDQVQAVSKRAAAFDDLMSQLSTQPESTLRALAGRAGVQLPAASPPAAQSTDPYGVASPQSEPAQPQPAAASAADPTVAQLTAQIEMLQQHQQVQAAAERLNGLRAEGMPVPADLTPQQVFAHMGEQRIGSFDAAVRDMMYPVLVENARLGIHNQETLREVAAAQPMAQLPASASLPQTAAPAAGSYNPVGDAASSFGASSVPRPEGENSLTRPAAVSASVGQALRERLGFAR